MIENEDIKELERHAEEIKKRQEREREIKLKSVERGKVLGEFKKSEAWNLLREFISEEMLRILTGLGKSDQTGELNKLWGQKEELARIITWLEYEISYAELTKKAMANEYPQGDNNY